MKGSGLLPKRLQVTYAPTPGDGGRMVWWGGGPDPGEAARRLRLPDGAPARLRLAVPHDDGVRARPVPVRLVPLTQAVPALAALGPSQRHSPSLTAWREVAAHALGAREDGRVAALAAAMPPAGHALCLDEETLWSARSLIAAFVAGLDHEYAAGPVLPRALLTAQDTDPGAPARVEASLRPYQRRGAGWLRTVAEHGSGALLADDMGLGKTLQTITLLAARPGDLPHLVVCPTSVLGNWARELARFAPWLPVVRHHGPGRGRTAAFPPGTVVVTSYSLMLRDAALLSDVDWDVVVLDEAQQIKNHTARTSLAARRLPARARIALTGTPVENRLAELWSIMDFANPGLLGPYPRFAKRFAEPIELRRDPGATTRLRELVAPFLLRRLKSEVATDLPAKLESTVACTLTAEQAKLYRRAVEEALDAGFGDGIERHGRVLALLTDLKQICNHPAQYLGKDGLPQDTPLSGRSGKLDRATEMLAEAVESGGRALVFTQYRVMGELLSRHLAAELGLGERVPFLHGGVSQRGRDAMVAAFQEGQSEEGTAPPVLIVSLKAGGTGLNLTAANHVLHFDRWWNPAVEDQATDRAHRIGQKRRVDVYKLVTGGTLEERIAALLERKRSLAEAIVGTGEDWITKLDDTELRALVELSDVEVVDE